MRYWLPLSVCLSLALASTYPEPPAVLTFLAGLLVATLPFVSDTLTAFCWRRVGKPESEVYQSIDHLVLNASCDTAWLNMGLWTHTTDYPTACEALAHQVAKAAHLDKGLRVLDVGCGTGESLRLWHDTYAPAKLVGVTSSAGHTDFALARLPAEVALHTADAVAWCAGQIDPASSRFDRVIALDSAYHFRTRMLFLKCAFDLLAPGGRIALADIVMSSSIDARDRLLLKVLCRAMGVPFQNMCTELEYIAQLETIGYRHTSIDDITPHVFTGLADYLSLRPLDPAMAAVTRPSLWFGYRTFAKVVRWWARGNVVRFVVVAAQKPPSSS